MNKSEIAGTLKREIEYRLKNIDDCNAGKLLHFDTPEKRDNWNEEQLTRIAEVEYIASKLHVKLT